MKPKLLPEALRSDLNRLAHALGQIHETAQRRRLHAEAMALFKAGRSPEEILREFEPARATS